MPTENIQELVSAKFRPKATMIALLSFLCVGVSLRVELARYDLMPGNYFTWLSSCFQRRDDYGLNTMMQHMVYIGNLVRVPILG